MNFKDRILIVLTNDKRYLDSYCKKIDEKLYNYLTENFKNEKYNTRSEFAYNLLYDSVNNKCVICNKSTKFNVRKWNYSNVCSKSCSNTNWIRKKLITDPDFYKKISKKVVKKKYNTIINGKNLHQITALNGVKKRKKKQKETSEKTIQTKLNNKSKKLLKQLERIINCINYFGVVRFTKIYIKIIKQKYKKYSTIKTKTQNILGNYYNCLINLYKFGFKEFYLTEIKNKNVFKHCKICNNIFSNYKFNNINFSISKNTCSVKCHSKYYYKFNENKNKGYQPTDEVRNKLSLKSKEMWNRKSPEERKRIINKINNTIFNTIIDGKNGYKRRSEKILLTRLKRKQISIIHNHENNKYYEYKKNIYNESKKFNLTLLENFDKRGKYTYHLDHIFPISKGFIYNIPAELIGNIKNLQFIPAFENISLNNKIKFIPDHIKQYLEEKNENIEKII